MSIELLIKANEKPKNGSGNGYPTMSITETIINGFFTVDHNWTVKSWNKAAKRLLGFSAEDIIGKNIWEEFAGVIPLNFYTAYQKAFLQDIPVHFEEYWAEMGAWFDVVTCHSDNILSVSFKSCSQPSYPAPPQQQQKILNELYRYVTEVTNDCLWEWNVRDREIFWIDGGHKRLFGYQVENSLISQSFWESCLHPGDKERLLKGLNKVIANGVDCIWEDEYRFKKANGEYAYVHDRGHIIYDEEKGTCRMIGATQDISSRKLTELKLLESEQKLSLITRQTMDTIIITDMEEKITWVNDAFTRITEYEPAEAIGRKPGSFLHGKDTDPATVDYMRVKIKDRQQFDCDIINYSKSGRRYCMHIHGQPLVNKEGNYEGYFAIETDITEKVRLEDKLVQLRQTKQKEVTEAVLTAHENERASIGKELHDNLNQILAAAKLYIQMAADYEDKRLVYLEKSSGYIGEVIDEIRKISKSFLTPGIHGTGLEDSIENILTDLRLQYPIAIELRILNIKDVELRKNLRLTIFRIVQEQLRNILQHANATEAVISLTLVENNVVLIISDNGRGSSTSSERKGVGIKNIISRSELYGGRVMILSNPGEGYELKVVFPLQQNPEQGELEF